MNKHSRHLFAIITILPGFALVILFLIIPTLQMFYQSLFEVSPLMGSSKFVGVENYAYLITDNDFFVSLKNTLFLMFITPLLVLTTAIILAVLVTQTNLREKPFYRVLFFIPSILPMVAVGILWNFIYDPTMGVINSTLKALGMGTLARPWLGDQSFAMWAVVVTMLWQGAGYYMVMYIAGIDRIPLELYESATLDGANGFQRFYKITLPFLWEVVRMTIIFAIGGAINIGFIITTIMTNGGPGISTTVVLKYMYQQAFVNSNFGYAMAVAVVVFLITFIISLISNKITEKESLEF